MSSTNNDSRSKENTMMDQNENIPYRETDAFLRPHGEGNGDANFWLLARIVIGIPVVIVAILLAIGMVA